MPHLTVVIVGSGSGTRHDDGVHMWGETPGRNLLGANRQRTTEPL